MAILRQTVNLTIRIEGENLDMLKELAEWYGNGKPVSLESALLTIIQRSADNGNSWINLGNAMWPELLRMRRDKEANAA